MAVDKQTPYGFGTVVKLPYAEAVERTKSTLREQGFGVLCEIDVKQTMKDKRGIDFRPYVILGACNPPLAEKALEAELDLGLLLPCNVVVYATDEGDSVVAAMNPERDLRLMGNPALALIANDVKQRLEAVIRRVSDEGQGT